MTLFRRLFPSEHQRFQEQLSAYLDAELDPRHRRRLEEHLASCPSCRAHLRTLEETVRLLHALPLVRPPRSFRLTPAMAGQARPAPRPGWAPAFPAATLVSALLLLVVLAADVGRTLGRPAAPAPAAVELQAEVRQEVEKVVEKEIAAASRAEEEAAPPQDAAAVTPAPAAPPAPPAPSADGLAPPVLGGLELGLLLLTLILGAISLRLRRR